MKYIAILTLSVVLAACEKKVPVVSVYDEVTTFTRLTEDRQTITTGAKLYLIDDIGPYSKVEVTLIHDGVATELSSQQFDSEHTDNHGMSIRFYPYRHGERHWSLLYRLPTTQETIYTEVIPDDWYITHANGSRHGRLDADVEVLDSFVLMRSGKYFDRPMYQQYRICSTEEDLLAFSKGKDYVKFVRVTLHK